MTRHVLATLFTTTWLAACSTASPDHVKTPDEWLAEQEAEGAKIQQEQEAEQRRLRRADHDRRREEARVGREAGRSRAQARGALRRDVPRVGDREGAEGQGDGDAHVHERRPRQGVEDQRAVRRNAVGKCVLRAMGNVIVPAYTGREKTVEWEIDLTGAKKSGPEKK